MAIRVAGTPFMKAGIVRDGTTVGTIESSAVTPGCIRKTTGTTAAKAGETTSLSGTLALWRSGRGEGGSGRGDSSDLIHTTDSTDDSVAVCNSKLLLSKTTKYSKTEQESASSAGLQLLVKYRNIAVIQCELYLLS